MPTYYSRSTTIQLGVADLQDTTTIELESRSRSAVYDEVTSCAAKFARASINGTLDETPILTEDASQTHARFLGQFSNMPFFMVRAGMGFFNSEAEGRRTRRPARVPPLIIDPVSSPQSPSSLRPPAASHKKEAGDANKSGGCENGPRAIPHALFLSVFLSKASFLPTYVEHLNKTIFHDIKIDIFVNGELCASTSVSDRYHGDAYEMTEHIIRFSGRRVHHQFEKPWVLVPPGQSADGRLRPDQQNTGSSGDAKQRWTSVSQALLLEAGRLARGSDGELSILGDYLSALAALEMPTEVEAMQMVGGPKIGIIDVVITAGKGNKDDATALRLMKPTPMRLEEPKKASASMEWDNIKDGTVIREKSVHQEVFRMRQGMASKGVDIANEATKAQVAAKAQEFSPNSTLDETFASPTKKRRSLGSRADTEILAQGFTSESRGLRGLSGLADDPVSSGNHAKPLSREGAPSNGRLTKNSHNNGTFSTQNSSINCAPSKNDQSHPQQPQEKLQSPLVNPSSDAKHSRPHLVQSQIASLESSDQRSARFDAPQGAYGRAPEPKLAQPKPPAQKAYKGDSAPSVPSKKRSERKKRWNWEIVVDNKLTLEEEMESIAAEAARTTSMLFPQSSAPIRARKAAASDPPKLNEQCSLMHEKTDSKRRKLDTEAASHDQNGSIHQEVVPPEKKSKIVKLQIRKSKPPRSPQPLKPLPTSSEPDLSLPAVPTSSFNFSVQPSPKSSSTIVPPTTPRKSPKPAFSDPFSFTPESSARHYGVPAYSPISLSHTWPGTPPLSDDAVVTYAPGDILRQVKSERSGWFVEKGVVMGVRFLLG